LPFDIFILRLEHAQRRVGVAGAAPELQEPVGVDFKERALTIRAGEHRWFSGMLCFRL
jgi:hypothetical protein